jgi:pimeloyl-ACP methyl ester carboxylesterase
VQHVNGNGLMPLKSKPFHVVGIGQGGSVALAFAVRHGPSYPRCLRSLALINSFASVDSQLAAILHSSVNVFSCFPPSRPELPVTYFSRFVFSEAYITKVRFFNLLFGVAEVLVMDRRPLPRFPRLRCSSLLLFLSTFWFG